MKEKLDNIKELLEKMDDAQLIDIITKQRVLVHDVRESLRSQQEHLRFLEAVYQARRTLRNGNPVVNISGPFNTGVTVSHNEFVAKTAVDAIKEVLLRNAAALHVDEIVHLLRRGGFPFRANYPEASIEVALKREKDVFEKVRPHVFRLKRDIDKNKSERGSTENPQKTDD